MKIASTLLPANHLGPDKIYWSYCPKGTFSVRSAYYALCLLNSSVQDHVWNLPWS